METSNCNEIPGSKFFSNESKDDFRLHEYVGEIAFFGPLVPQNYFFLNNNQEMEENKFSLCDDDKFVAVGESKSKNVKHSTKEGKKESSLKIEISKQEKKTKKKRCRKSKNILEQRKVKKVFFNSINKGIIRKEIIKILKEEKTKKLFSTDEQNNTERRKFDSDNIRKKIKANFLKWVKKYINKKLISANSQQFFDYFPQCFIKEINKIRNKEIINKSFKELVNIDFYNRYQSNKNNTEEDKQNLVESPDEKKYKNNSKVMKYLEKNEDIRKKINFDDFENLTFEQLFNEYLKSEEFDEHIYKLKLKESKEYVKKYIILAFDYINYFSK
jgi:hypothetical protein